MQQAKAAEPSPAPLEVPEDLARDVRKLAEVYSASPDDVLRAMLTRTIEDWRKGGGVLVLGLTPGLAPSPAKG